MSINKLLLIAAIGSISIGCRAQDTVKITRDTIYIEPQDTVLIKSYADRYNPRKALLYAAVVPGLGQVYNKKYWKLPLVYGGFYWIWSYVDHNNNLYKRYKEHLYYNLEHNLTGTAVNPATNITTDNLRRIVDRARRERDFYVILMGGMYLLQMIDAHVDAHLKEFDLNPNLHAKIKPTFTQEPMVGRLGGVSLRLRF